MTYRSSTVALVPELSLMP